MSQEAREFTGLSATEAAINACEEFGVNRSDIEYEVISETGEGLDKQVVIQAKLKEGVQLGAANHESGYMANILRSPGEIYNDLPWSFS